MGIEKAREQDRLRKPNPIWRDSRIYKQRDLHYPSNPAHQSLSKFFLPVVYFIQPAGGLGVSAMYRESRFL